MPVCDEVCFSPLLGPVGMRALIRNFVFPRVWTQACFTGPAYDRLSIRFTHKPAPISPPIYATTITLRAGVHNFTFNIL